MPPPPVSDSSQENNTPIPAGTPPETLQSTPASIPFIAPEPAVPVIVTPPTPAPEPVQAPVVPPIIVQPQITVAPPTPEPAVPVIVPVPPTTPEPVAPIIVQPQVIVTSPTPAPEPVAPTPSAAPITAAVQPGTTITVNVVTTPTPPTPVTPAPEVPAVVVATPAAPVPTPPVQAPVMPEPAAVVPVVPQPTPVPPVVVAPVVPPSAPTPVVPKPVPPVSTPAPVAAQPKAKKNFWSTLFTPIGPTKNVTAPIVKAAVATPSILVPAAVAPLAAVSTLAPLVPATAAPGAAVPTLKKHFWSTLFTPRVAKKPAVITPVAPVLKAPVAPVEPQPKPAIQKFVKPKRSFWSMFSWSSKKKDEQPVALSLGSLAAQTHPSAIAAEPASAPVTPDPLATLATFAAENGSPVKGKIISAGDVKKEEEEKKEQARRTVEQTKREMEEERAAKEKGKTPVSVIPKKPAIKKPAGNLEKLVASIAHIGMGKERMQFTANLATMLGAGLPLVDSLQTLKTETRNKGFKQVVKRIVDMVENGSPLWRAMDSENLFSLHAIALIRIGEEAGNLAKNMEYLALQESKDRELVQKVKMAMIYPVIVLSIMFVVVMGLGLFVLPNLIGVLTSLNVPLPLPTRIVIAFTNAFTNYGIIIVPGSIVFIIVFVILAKFTPLKVPVQWVLFRIPGIGALLRDATIARFGVILGGLLQAGVPVLDAVQSLVQVTSILVYKKFYAKLREHITVGDSFAKTFASIKGSEKLLPPSVQQLVITGEKSGALSMIMLKIADIYDKKASETAQKLPVILEPILLLGIGVLVGTIAIAIIVPIYSIVGNVGRS